jgi:hypothetical protein
MSLIRENSDRAPWLSPDWDGAGELAGTLEYLGRNRELRDARDCTEPVRCSSGSICSPSLCGEGVYPAMFLDTKFTALDRDPFGELFGGRPWKP